ncbi:putative membrane spanning protein [Granulibacter bethesdensis]|uniref:Membrane spanning protein n=1 Tax=Granulibacter bethesdensis TaxID=364410 RepID=A0AAN0RBZ2_9PROT|nr:lysylphosphatidylglycerol synthase domain-containing protein [Granulibacter bethesdensis]AHJ61984.1 putative membrane spanning protein [Granulibacter bethesdensis]AHJ64605.1 putative membrane spanning protein [Granulibacter bethesdensis CGDNIH4]
MNIPVLLGLLAGLAIVTLLVLEQNAGAVWHSLTAIGWEGFSIIVLYHLNLIGLMGLAWWMLGRNKGRPWWFTWGRLIRDSAAETLPLSQLGGYVLGGRAATLAGIPGAFAAASTVVDVTTELVAQLVYTLIGLTLLSWNRPDSGLVTPLLYAVSGMGVLVSLFIILQARGLKGTDRLGASLSRHLLGQALARSAMVQDDIRRIYATPSSLFLAGALHLLCWIISGLETWLTIRLLGINLPVTSAIAIDSLLYGIRSLAFMIPNAIGVQEGGLIFLGGLFGLGGEAALAISLIKRGRDLAIGIPALLLWQWAEGRRALLQRNHLPPDQGAPPTIRSAKDLH